MSSMKEKCAGFDFGSRYLHIAVRERGRIKRVVMEEIPEGLIRDGRILSYEAMSDFLRGVRKDKKLYVKNAALSLPPSLCFCRRSRVPYMTDGQLQFNLPYEFRDYITGDKNDYYFDYTVVDTVTGEDGSPRELDLVAAAAAKSLVREYDEMFRHAGFKLKTIVPEEMAYINLIRLGACDGHSHCILDIGHSGIRLYVFNGDRYESVRALDFGCSSLVGAIADHFNIDTHVAETYLDEDYENATRLPACESIYSDIALEVLKAANFFSFNNGGVGLSHIHICGGGARNEALCEMLRESLHMPLSDMSEFWPDAAKTAEDADLAAAAAGAALQ